MSWRRALLTKAQQIAGLLKGCWQQLGVVARRAKRRRYGGARQGRDIGCGQCGDCGIEIEAIDSEQGRERILGLHSLIRQARSSVLGGIGYRGSSFGSSGLGNSSSFGSLGGSLFGGGTFDIGILRLHNKVTADAQRREDNDNDNDAFHGLFHFG